MGLEGTYLRLLREVAHVLEKLLSIIFEKSRCSGEVPNDWKKEYLAYLKKERGGLGNSVSMKLTSLQSQENYQTNPPQSHFQAK